jgi:putative endonuclease
MKSFYLYLLRCNDGSYYCGHTDNLEARLYQHEVSEIGYTATRKPVALAWQGEFKSREEALAFELQITGWSRVKKEALIAGDWEKISTLAKARQGNIERSCPSTSLYGLYRLFYLTKGRQGAGVEGHRQASAVCLLTDSLRHSSPLSPASMRNPAQKYKRRCKQAYADEGATPAHAIVNYE